MLRQSSIKLFFREEKRHDETHMCVHKCPVPAQCVCCFAPFPAPRRRRRTSTIGENEHSEDNMTPQADKFLSKAVNGWPDALKNAILEADLDNASLLRAYARIFPELLGLTWGEQSVEGSADENILASAEYDFPQSFADIPSASIAGFSTDNPVTVQIGLPEFPEVLHPQTTPATSNQTQQTIPQPPTTLTCLHAPLHQTLQLPRQPHMKEVSKRRQIQRNLTDAVSDVRRRWILRSTTTIENNPLQSQTWRLTLITVWQEWSAPEMRKRDGTWEGKVLLQSIVQRRLQRRSSKQLNPKHNFQINLS